MPLSAETTWRVPSPEALVVRHWPGEDEHLIFHETSGDLHLLTPQAAAVLERLALGPASASELAHSVAGLDADAAQAVVGSLDQIGLIVPVEP